MSNEIYTIERIKNLVYPVAVKHSVDRIYLFGSYARGSADHNSDIDLCVDSSGIRGMFALGGLYADLKEALNKELDLITLKSLTRSKDADFVENLRKDGLLIYEHEQ